MKMKVKRKQAVMLGLIAVFAVLLAITMLTGKPSADGEYTSTVYATALSLLPPVIAIGLALFTKEVYTSLLAGILAGALLYANGNLELMLNTMLFNEDGGMVSKLSDSGNVGILVFLVMLGILVSLLNKAGGSAAFGKWASKHIKTRIGAQISVMILGVLIFIDDYFNCLTVGSVMRPITDKHNISRSKLAYLIDSTAAPICIIAPISSWAAAVSGTVEGVNGISLFINTIPYNLYAFLTILMVIFISVSDTDYGPMKIHEDNAKNGDIFTTKNNTYEQDAQPVTERGRVIDLILPVAVLIVFCVVGMIYTGGFFSGTDFVTAFANCDAAYGLSLGSISALIVIIAYYMLRRVLKFNECMDSIAAGFKQMVPAILILTFAWTLKTMTNHLEAGAFVSGVVQSATALSVLLPVILFVVAIGLAFATGTSWGTFGILIPIVTSVFEAELANVSQTGEIPSMVIICISACLAGAVCGDHCSPISDTTIMASTGAQCDHVNHVSTQLPYALTVAAVCVVGYLLSGFVHNVFIVLGFSAALMLAVLFAIRFFVKRKEGRG